MAITQCITNVFLYDLATGAVNLSTDTLKMALYTSSADLGPDTVAYTTMEEVSGAGYTAGGATLTNVSLTGGASSEVTWLDFDDVSWPNSTITARGALIYDATNSNRAIAVLDFGSDRVSNASTFTVKIPEPTADTAILAIRKP